MMRKSRLQVVSISIFVIMFIVGCNSTVPILSNATSESDITETRTEYLNTSVLNVDTRTPNVLPTNVPEITLTLTPELRVVTRTPTILPTNISEITPTLTHEPINIRDNRCEDETNPSSHLQLVYFVSEWDGDQEIYSVQANGDNLKQWTYNEADDYSPSWAPDGSKMLFLRKGRDGMPRLFLFDSVTNLEEEIRLNTNQYIFPQIVWAPDSQIFVISVRNQDNSLEIILVDLSGNTLSTLSATDNNLLGVSLRSWSHKHNLILMDTYLDSKSILWRLAIADFDKSEIRILYSENTKEWQGEWHPNEGRIVYIREPDLGATPPQIFIVNPEGEELAQITNDEKEKNFVRWSASGELVIFVANDGNTTITPTYQLYLVRDNGIVVDLLFESSNKISDPNWAPNGQFISFIQNENGIRNLYVVDVCNHEIIKLAENIVDTYSLNWKP